MASSNVTFASRLVWTALSAACAAAPPAAVPSKVAPVAFVAQDGDVYVSHEPLGALDGAVRSGPLGEATNEFEDPKLAAVATGRSAILGLTIAAKPYLEAIGRQAMDTRSRSSRSIRSATTRPNPSWSSPPGAPLPAMGRSPASAPEDTCRATTRRYRCASRARRPPRRALFRADGLPVQ